MSSDDRDLTAKAVEADQPPLDYQQTDVFVYDGKNSKCFIILILKMLFISNFEL